MPAYHVGYTTSVKTVGQQQKFMLKSINLTSKSLCWVFSFFLTPFSVPEPGSPAIPPNSAPGRTEADGGTTAATQPIPTVDTTLAEPTHARWPSTAQTTAWCG